MVRSECLWGVLIGTTLVFSAQGAVIYSDDLSGSGSDDLAGAAPDVRPGTEVWSAGAGFNADGSFDSALDTSTGSASLPFVPGAGFVYTLTAVVDPVSAGATNPRDWVILGFQENQNDANALLGPPSPSMFFRGDRVGVNPIGTRVTSAGGFTNHDPAVDLLGPTELKIILDTTDTAWTVDFVAGGTSVTGVQTFASNPTINYVFFGTTIQGSIDSFELTAVPEPASAALMGLGGLWALLRRRE